MDDQYFYVFKCHQCKKEFARVFKDDNQQKVGVCWYNTIDCKYNINIEFAVKAMNLKKSIFYIKGGVL